MSIVYLLKNQHAQYLNKSGEWVDGDAASTLFRSKFRDEAINQKVELSVKQMEMRIEIVEATLNAQGLPEVSYEKPQQLNQESVEQEEALSETSSSEATISAEKTIEEKLEETPEQAQTESTLAEASNDENREFRNPELENVASAAS